VYSDLPDDRLEAYPTIKSTAHAADGCNPKSHAHPTGLDCRWENVRIASKSLGRAVIQPESPKFRYRVDGSDVLVWVDAWWLAFARENGAPELTEEFVLGRNLWEFVADCSTQKLYQRIHVRVRSTRKPVVLPFRCDSPTVRRHMRLTILGEDADHLLYEGMLTRVETRSPLAVLDPACPRADALLTMCSFCKRALSEPSGWLEVEDAAARLGLFEQPKAPRLSYTVCEDCSNLLSRTPANDDQ
jgi:hypothetical protein